MKVIVNGSEKILGEKATLKDAVKGEHYVKDTLISVHLSTEKTTMESNDFEIITSLGSLVIHLEDAKAAEIWKTSMREIEGITARWVTHDIAAFGSFVTDIPVDREVRTYKRYDCFFSLGGFDNNTTYIMIAKEDHKRSYGAKIGNIGRITKGRHILDVLKEGDQITGIRPVTSETSTDNVIVTSDLKYRLEEGYRIDTHVLIELNEHAPESSEHVLILASKGFMRISDATGSYAACSDDKDVAIPDEPHAVRNRGSVTVRNSGEGLGRVFFYRDRRQMIIAHNDVGRILNGMEIASVAKAGDNLSVLTSPQRLLSVGMTQKEGEVFLAAAGVKQRRTGDTSDDAIIAEQTPELTIIALRDKEVETLGVPKEGIFKVALDRKKAPETVRYFEKVTGLSHKSIGSMKVHFTFEDMPMITFEGDDVRGQVLYPHDPFKRCRRGDLGVTNQVRPYRGLIGIRLTDSKEYGPTGEEGYATNIFGRFDDDLDRFMKDLKEDDIVYITERKL
ncbi:MAG: methanogenesis marker 3 protein [Candidatus Methanomethylophilaceae archaeon]